LNADPTPDPGRYLAPVCADDRGENPLGWSTSTVPVTVTTSSERIATLTAALSAVRRQCADWAAPTSAVTRSSKMRDRAVANAAGLLLELIDHLAPDLDQEPQPEPETEHCAPCSPAGRYSVTRDEQAEALHRLRIWADALDTRAQTFAGHKAVHPLAVKIRRLIAEAP